MRRTVATALPCVSALLILAAASGAQAQCVTAGDPCDDGLFCTVGDVCDATLVCTGVARDCGEGNVCTSDPCDEAGDVCTHPPRPVGYACSDGAYCTVGDQCDGSGTCLAGTPRGCGDGLACTRDSCDEGANACVNTVTTGCRIGGACIADGAGNPRDPCEACVPGTATNRYTALSEGDRCGPSACAGGNFTPSPTCDAAGVCNASTARSCTSGLCLDARTCAECVEDSHCAAGEHCAASMQCAPDHGLAEDCVGGGDCQSGFCADGVCCDAMCNGPCRACDTATGICANHPAGSNPEPECPPPGTCDGDGACTAPVFDAGPEDGGPDGGGVDGGATFDGGPGLEAHGSGLLCSAGHGEGATAWPLGIAVALAAAGRRRHRR